MVKIVDASVAIKWFVEEEGRETALEVLADILNGARNFAVPELFYFELTNVFYRLIPHPSKTQEELLEHVFELGLNRFSMTTKLLQEAKKFCLLGLSGYDASYLALASFLNGKWITFDKKAYKLVSKTNLCELLEAKRA